MVNRLLIGGAVAAAATVAGVGVWLGTSGAVDLVADAGAPATVTAPGGGAGAVSYFACPNRGELGALHGGDRVFLTGRDASGDWVEVRSPVEGSPSAWVRAELVDPDEAADLPETSCDLAGQVPGSATTVPDETPGATTTTAAPGETTTTTTTTTVPGQTTTTGPSTPTTRPGTPTTRPVTPPTTPPTTPPQPAPKIGPIARSRTSIIEKWDGVCNAGPFTSTISATITGATSVTMTWNVGSQSGSPEMLRQGSTFSAVLGPFGDDTVSSSTPITVTIRAVGPGGTAQRSITEDDQVTLHDCTFG